MKLFLETDRLLLRQFTSADAEQLYNLDNDPEVMRFLNGGKPKPRAEIENDFLPGLLAFYDRSHRYGFWAAVAKATGEFLGWFQLVPTESVDPAEAELGYRLCRSAWGRGFATEGSKALIRKAFTELGMQRIIARTMTVNTRSRRVMEKVGLTYVRTFFQSWPEYIEGAEQGDVEYALTKAEWERQEADRARTGCQFGPR